MAPAMGFETKVGFATSNSGSPPADPTVILETTNFDVKLSRNRVRTDGIRGVRSVSGHRMRPAARFVSGGFNMQPTAVELANLFPWIYGTAGTGSGTVTYALADTALPSKDVFSRMDGKGWFFRECVVQRATFSSQQGQPLGLRLDLLGKDRDDPPATYSWPALAIDYDDLPFMHYEAVLTLGGTVYQFRSATLTIDNAPAADRFLNSITPTDFPTGDRIITLTVDQPWGGNSALLNTLRDADVAGTLVYTLSSGVVLTFTFPYLVPPQLDDPTVQGREEIFFPYTLQACSDVSGGSVVKELSTTIYTPA